MTIRKASIFEHRAVKLGLVIFVLSMAVRLTLIFGMNLYQKPQRVEMDRIAISLSRGDGFSDPFNCRTGPTALYPPVYPAVLALNYLILGAGWAGELGKLILNTVIVSTLFALLPGAATRLGLKMVVGMIAGVIGAVIPAYFLSEVRGGELGLAALFTLWIVMRTHKHASVSEWSPLAAVQDGLLGGVALLTTSSAAAILAVCWAFCLRRGRRRASPYVATVMGIALVLITPWAVRNYINVGSFILLRSNLWLELQISNNELSRVTAVLNQTSGAYQRYHPFTNTSECAILAQLGEPQYMERKKEIVLLYIRENPLRFAVMTLQRVLSFWLPSSFRLGQAIVGWGITITAAFGLWYSWKQTPIVGQIIGYIWLFFPGIFYLVAIDNRYRYPILWSQLLMSAISIECIWNCVRGKAISLGWLRKRLT